MKRLLFILAVYVLASMGVRAQVVSGEEDSIKVLWENEVQDKYGNVFIGIRTPIYKSFDKNHLINTLYLANSPFGDNYNHLQKRDIETGEVVFEKEFELTSQPNQMRMSDDGKLLAITRVDSDTLVYIYDAYTFEKIKEIKISKYDALDETELGHNISLLENRGVAAVNFTSDNKSLIASLPFSYNPTLNTRGVTCVYDIETEKFMDEITYIQGEKLWAKFMDHTIDGYFLAICPSFNRLYIYNAQNYEIKRKILLSGDEIQNMYFSKSGNYLIIVYKNNKPDTEKDITLYNVNTGEIQNLPLFNNLISNPYLTEDDKYLLLGSIDEHMIYNLQTGEKHIFPKIDDKNIFYPNVLYDEEENLLINYSERFIRLIDFDIDYVTGVSPNEDNLLRLYPNPADDILNIPLDKNTVEIKIIKYDGKTISTISKEELQTSSQYYQYDISKLINGSYLVRLISPKATKTYQFIKQ